MLSYCFLVSVVSDEQSVVNLAEDPLYIMNCISLAAFGIPYLSLGFDNLPIMCLGVGLFKFILLEFLGCIYSCLSSNLRSYYFLKYFLQIFFFFFLISLWHSYDVCICWHAWWCPTRSLGSVHFSFFCVFWSLDWLISIAFFQFADSFFCLLKSTIAFL